MRKFFKFNDGTEIVPIWLVLLVVGLTIFIIPGLIASFMTLPVFSEAPGNTDAWISFWGSYLGGIFGMIGVIVTTFFIIQNQNIQNKRERIKDFEQKNLEKILEMLFEIKYLINTSDLKRLNTELDLKYRSENRHNIFSGEDLINQQTNLISVEEDIKKVENLINSLKSKFTLIGEIEMISDFMKNTINYKSLTSRFNYNFINQKKINPTEKQKEIDSLISSIQTNKDNAIMEVDGLIEKINIKIKVLHN